ncbi:unnamed protein product [Oikopleura dioica]|uniref:Uncharacterized protein n=1 Tax=Oikopleura dioica TaxID=34765 RepID=E4Y9P3_OIKDI|nr:unnamed protein product [Oikopleura dioica]
MTLSQCKIIACPYNNDEESCLCVCQQCHLERCQCSCSMVLPITSPVSSVIENDDTSLEDATVRPLVRSKKTFPNEGLSNSSAIKSDAEMTTTPTKPISSTQTASTTSTSARTQITSLIFICLLFLSSY